MHAPKQRISLTAVVAVLSVTAGHAFATTLIYQPVDPSFGGNPLNGPVLLDIANAQNKYKDPSMQSFGPGGLLGQQSALQQFNNQLQQAILSRVASSVTNSIVGPNGQLIPGTIETGSFSINIVNVGSGVLQITTTDKSTGASTTFQVSQ
ncbi:curli assembly protein CsgF [Cupriavidus necator]|uniref:Curli production assembly/transport component CsgF n=2 Tax=Cupriavidus necator TaxID=106590 RepID=A0A1U9UUW5_CUPNE|nr:curli assembly protein CsgF [Cupriavidus necator]